MSSERVPPPILIAPLTQHGDIPPLSPISGRQQSQAFESASDIETSERRIPRQEHSPGPSSRQVETRQGLTHNIPDRENTASTNESPRNNGLPVNIPQASPHERFPSITFSDQAHRRTRASASRTSSGNSHQSGLEQMVPVYAENRGHTVGERLQPTLDVALTERNNYAMKAKTTGLILNAAIGLQVLLGSLTTGLSALAVSGHGGSAAVQTTILGALSTMVASYLARARGSNEPELSISRVKDLEHFIRECQAFQLDHGNIVGDGLNGDLERFRRRFEEILGNTGGERKAS